MPIRCQSCAGQGYHAAGPCPACKGHGVILLTKSETCSQCKGRGQTQAGWQVLSVACTLCHGIGELRWWSAPEALLPPIPCADLAAAIALLHVSLHGAAGPQPDYAGDTVVGTALHLIYLDQQQHQTYGAAPGELLARILSQGGAIIMAHDGVYHDPLTSSPAVRVFSRFPQ